MRPSHAASVEDETGDLMPNDMQPTIDETLSGFLRTLSSANKSAATITALPDRSAAVRALPE